MSVSEPWSRARWAFDAASDGIKPAPSDVATLDGRQWAAVDVSSYDLPVSYDYDYRSDFARPPPVEAALHGYDISSNFSDPFAASSRVLRAFSGLEVSLVTPSGAGSRARFVVNSAGDALDTGRITIPEGKFGYLLDNPIKSGVFTDSMGFTQGTLDPALRAHLVDNFGTATRSVPMVGGGMQFSITGPLVGPSGQKWMITTAWGVDPNRASRLITATP